MKYVIWIFLFSLCLSGAAVHGADTLLVYAGAASKPPTEEAAKLYEQKTGVKVDLVIGGSGYVLSQMRLAKQGDIYFPGSSDYVEKAKREGDVIAGSQKVIVYLVPAINVVKGNPHGIRALQDLTEPGIKVAIANPEGVCVGAYAVEIIEKAFTAAKKAAFQANLVNYAESCEKTATVISPEDGGCRDRLERVRVLGSGAHRNDTAAGKPGPAHWLHPHCNFQVYQEQRSCPALYRFHVGSGRAQDFCPL